MRNKLSATALLTLMLLSMTYAQEQSPVRSNQGARTSEAKKSKAASTTAA